jgi:hypothetical protein
MQHILGVALFHLQLSGCHYTNRFLLFFCFDNSGNTLDQTYDLLNTRLDANSGGLIVNLVA